MAPKKTQVIHLLAAGGTIGKVYDERNGSLGNSKPVFVKKLKERLRLPYTELHIEEILAKDSLEMDDQDRQLIVEKIEQLNQVSPHPIVILHGTDTMALSAQYCLNKLSTVSSAVIFTGAMKPFGFVDTDAWQNTMEALALANHVKPGVYISFHNKLFDAETAEKDYENLTFAVKNK